MTTVSEPAPRTPKAEQTRRAIVDAAMRLFREGGYEGTTMRAIADEAGVSVGNAYYYFSSKEHLIQAFYDRMQEEHAAAAAAVLAEETAFAARLAACCTPGWTWRRRTRSSPASSSRTRRSRAARCRRSVPESAGPREESIALYRRVVEGSDLKVAKALREELPELLWLLQMGVVLFWVYDASEGQRRSRTLVDGVAPMVDRLARMTRLPVVRGVVDDLVGLLRTLRAG